MFWKRLAVRAVAVLNLISFVVTILGCLVLVTIPEARENIDIQLLQIHDYDSIQVIMWCFGGSVVLAFIFGLDVGASVLILGYTSNKFSGKVSLKWIKIWIRVNAIFLLILTACSLRVPLLLIQVFVRFISVCVVCMFLEDIRNPIMAGPTSTHVDKKPGGNGDVESNENSGSGSAFNHNILFYLMTRNTMISVKE